MNEDRTTPAEEPTDRDGPPEDTEPSEGRETVEDALARGDTVRTDVVEHATIESELVDREVIARETVTSETLTEDVVRVSLLAPGDRETADAGRERSTDEESRSAAEGGREGADATGAGGSDPVGGSGARSDRLPLDADEGHAGAVGEDTLLAVEIDETRSEIEEVFERKTIESRVVEEDADVEVEVEGVHERLVGSELVRVDPDEVVLDEVDLEGEFVDGGIRSFLTERRTVERDVAERKVATARVTDVDTDGGAATAEEVVERELVDAAEVPDGTVRTSAGGVDEGRGDDATTGTGNDTTAKTASEGTVGAGESAIVDVTEADMGKDAVLPSGEEIGLVSDVDPEDDTVYVEPDPGLTDQLKADLHWGDEDDAYSLDGSRIERITGDAVVVESVD